MRMQLTNIPQYELVEKRELKEIGSIGYVMRHKKTGARVFVLENDDDNKVFNIAFRTPPSDSTGVPHILEHSVLCGSNKYPVKDPFVELVKGSLNTFLNAMTYPDKTMYPVASCNDKDFQNLMSVYLDAVFCPNIYKNEKIFLQEGWHYELESKEGNLIYNGVVYNEMKGAFSSPDSVLERYTQRVLFPHTSYANESGGDPICIPDLTYEAFLDFHRKYYHPSNSYIYLYGNMNMEEKLNFIDQEYLSHYDAIVVNSEIQEETAFDQMADEEVMYGITDEESKEEATYYSWNKVTGSTLDPKQYLAFQVLEYALLNAPGAPLRQALVQSGIGKDVYGGYECELRQTYFSVVAKDAKAGKKAEFVQCIEDTLKEVVEQGLNKKSLLAGINILEFKLREADYGRFPKGLMYGIQCFDSWLYDETDPMMHLAYDHTFASLREEVNTDYYEALIEKYLIKGTHGAILTLIPERGYTAKIDAQVAKRLETYKQSLTEAQLEELVQKTKELKQYQDEPSSSEELKCIPMLQVSDIERKIQPLHNEMCQIGDTKVLFHDIFSNGIGYLDLLFSADEVDTEDLPYLALLKSVLGYIDTEHYTYQELADEINIHTGGIMPGITCFTHQESLQEPFLRFGIRTKAMYGELGKAFELIHEIIQYSKLDDEKRLKEIVSEQRSRGQSYLMSYSHSIALMRAGSYYCETGYLGEVTAGISYYQFLEDLDERFEEKKTIVVEKLKKLSSLVFNKKGLFVSYTSDKEGYKVLEKELVPYLETLPEREICPVKRNYHLEKKNEGFQTSSQVQYVARCGEFKKKGYQFHGSMRILQVILNYDYLWTNLRVKGGAYGCMSALTRDGQGYFVSYRDPNLVETNQIYDKIPEYLRNIQIDERDMTKYIIGTISDMDTPMNPSAKGLRGLNAYMTGVTEEMLQKERDEVIDSTQEDIRNLAGPVQAVLDENAFCVIGNQEKIAANQDLFKEVKPLFH